MKAVEAQANKQEDKKDVPGETWHTQIFLIVSLFSHKVDPFAPSSMWALCTPIAPRWYHKRFLRCDGGPVYVSVTSVQKCFELRGETLRLVVDM